MCLARSLPSYGKPMSQTQQNGSQQQHPPHHGRSFGCKKDLYPILKEKPYYKYRQGRKQHPPCKRSSFCLAKTHSICNHFPNLPPKHNYNAQCRGNVYNNLKRSILQLNTKKCFTNHKVPAAAHGQEFRQPLYKT